MEQKASRPQAISASASDSDTPNASQPFARLALRVGVTGHRLNNLRSADTNSLRGQIRTVLQFLKQIATNLQVEADALYEPESPVLRVISPLAEGADRFVAEEGLALGFELQCPLPFIREEYEKDFQSQASREQFNRLLAQAAAMVELPGLRNTRDAPNGQNESYEAVGRMVLAQSDAIIAIWNGGSGKQGGTGQIVAEAEQLRIPIVWIDSRAPHSMRVKAKQCDDWKPWANGGSESLLTRIKEAAKGGENLCPDLTRPLD